MIKFYIYGPRTYFYKRIIQEFSIAFKDKGIDSYFTTDQSKIEKIINKYNNKKDEIFVFLINYIFDDSKISGNIKIINWIQDYKFSGNDMINFNYSEKQFYYFLINPIAWNLRPKNNINWSILLPATNAKPKNKLNKFKLDASFVGFIPSPINPKHIIKCPKSENSIEINDILSSVNHNIFYHSTFSLKRLQNEIKKIINKFGLVELSSSDQHILEEIIPRTIERREIIKQIASDSLKFKIYGPKTWIEWPEFKKFYSTEIKKYKKLLSLYSTTKINIHNGALGIHWRTVDIMSLGGFVITNKSKFDNLEGGINKYLKNKEDFVFYDKHNINKIIHYYLANPRLINEIGQSSRKKIEKFHTWANRVDQIIKDLKIEYQKKKRPVSKNIDKFYFYNFI